MMFDDYPIFGLGVGDICSLGNLVFPTHGRCVLRPWKGMDRWTRQMGDSSPSPMRNHQRICKKKKKERNIWIILDRWSLLEVSQCFPSGFSNGFPDGFSASTGAFNTMESFPLGALFSTTSMAPRCQRPWTMPAGDLQNLHTIYICMYNIRMCIYICIIYIYTHEWYFN